MLMCSIVNNPLFNIPPCCSARRAHVARDGVVSWRLERISQQNNFAASQHSCCRSIHSSCAVARWWVSVLCACRRSRMFSSFLRVDVTQPNRARIEHDLFFSSRSLPSLAHTQQRQHTAHTQHRQKEQFNRPACPPLSYAFTFHFSSSLLFTSHSVRSFPFSFCIVFSFPPSFVVTVAIHLVIHVGNINTRFYPPLFASLWRRSIRLD